MGLVIRSWELKCLGFAVRVIAQVSYQSIHRCVNGIVVDVSQLSKSIGVWGSNFGVNGYGGIAVLSLFYVEFAHVKGLSQMRLVSLL